ncbi:GPW/gp25 family protein [Methylocystis sp. IM3]|uniref:GPW/gp25 family protein n=1 Tax=unclassified Methylocystis TaxID=2625913 RepID=UPI0030FA0951
MSAPFNADAPLRIGADGRTVGAAYDKHVRDMIEALLFTQQGERVMRPEMGSGLLQYPFAPNSPELAAALQLTARSGLERWLGDVIEVRSLSVEAEDATLVVTLTWALRGTGAFTTEPFVRSLE